MIDFLSLVKDTGAYKIIKGDKENGRLSHAYLIVADDPVYLKDYLKVFAKVIACGVASPCDNCRTCSLIGEESLSDVMFFPKGDKPLSTDDVNTIIEESYLRPIESQKKIFVLTATEPLSAVVQNKLLKTLEEPPKDVHILIGATSEYGILSTVLSRVRKLEIPTYSNEKLISVLSGMDTEENVNSAVSSSTGTLGSAVKLLGDENLSATTDVVVDVLTGMKSSKDVLEYSIKVSALKGGFGQFLSVLELALSDIQRALASSENAVKNPSLYNRIKDSGFNLGSVIHAIEKVEEAFKRKKFNANAQMLTEWLLFQILEGKFKWRKS